MTPTIKIIALSKTETKAAELNTVALQNIAIPDYSKKSNEDAMAWLKEENPNPETIEDLFKYWVFKWYRIHNFSPNDTLDSQTDKISTILDIRPQYHVNYQYRTAVWGFKIEGYEEKIIIYNSKRGTMIFVEPTISKDYVKKLLQHLTTAQR